MYKRQVLDNTDPAFYKTYSNSDFLKFFVTRVEENDGTVLDTAKLKCKAMMKFLPYDGFYPVQRTLQLATLFSSSYLMNIDSGSQRVGLTPFFGPGILYNSIKAGIGMEFSMPKTTTKESVGTGADRKNAFVIPGGQTGTPSTFIKFPFESIIDPIPYILKENKAAASTQITWRDLYIDNASSINNTYSPLSSKSQNGKPAEYNLAIHNFLAETVNYFLPEGRLNTMVSEPGGSSMFGKSFEKIMKGSGSSKPTEYKMRITISNNPAAANAGETYLKQNP